MAKAHDNIDNLTLLNSLKNYMKYGGDKRDLTNQMWKDDEIGSAMRFFRDRGMKRGNFQSMGIDPFDKPRPGEIGSDASDFMIQAASTPNMLQDLTSLLSGIYNPKSKTNIARERDLEGENKLDALTKTVESMYGDDVNILDVIGTLNK